MICETYQGNTQKVSLSEVVSHHPRGCEAIAPKNVVMSSGSLSIGTLGRKDHTVTYVIIFLNCEQYSVIAKRPPINIACRRHFLIIF